METPYKAHDDNELYNKLEVLHGEFIKPMYIETDGTILVELTNSYDWDDRIKAYVDRDGITLCRYSAKGKNFALSTHTLMQLAAMSAAYSAGYAAARQKDSEL